MFVMYTYSCLVILLFLILVFRLVYHTYDANNLKVYESSLINFVFIIFSSEEHWQNRWSPVAVLEREGISDGETVGRQRLRSTSETRSAERAASC